MNVLQKVWPAPSDPRGVNTLDQFDAYLRAERKVHETRSRTLAVVSLILSAVSLGIWTWLAVG